MVNGSGTDNHPHPVIRHEAERAEPEAHVALLDRAGCIVAVNEAWKRFARANGGDLAACGVGASYLDACDAASDEGSRMIGDHIRSAIAGRMFAAKNVMTLCATPTADLWFNVLVSSRVDRDLESRGAAVVLVPVQEPSSLDRTHGPSAERSILDAAVAAVAADYAVLRLEERGGQRCLVLSSLTTTTSSPCTPDELADLFDEPSSRSGPQLLATAPGLRPPQPSCMRITLPARGSRRARLLMVREPGRTPFAATDLQFLIRLGSFINEQLVLAASRDRAEALREALIREEISKALQQSTVSSILTALNSLESVAEAVRPSTARIRVESSISDLEAALVGVRGSLTMDPSPGRA